MQIVLHHISLITWAVQFSGYAPWSIVETQHIGSNYHKSLSFLFKNETCNPDVHLSVEIVQLFTWYSFSEWVDGLCGRNSGYSVFVLCNIVCLFDDSHIILWRQNVDDSPHLCRVWKTLPLPWWREGGSWNILPESLTITVRASKIFFTVPVQYNCQLLVRGGFISRWLYCDYHQK